MRNIADNMPVDDIEKVVVCLYWYIVKNFGRIFLGDLVRDCNGIICWKYGCVVGVIVGVWLKI